MILVPIPPSQIESVRAVVVPFLDGIADRIGVDSTVLWSELIAGDTQAHVVWDETTDEAKALIGTRIFLRGDRRIGELCWATGSDRGAWFDLIDDLETYLREHQHCVALKAICRPGWKKPLQAKGFRLTHLVMEKN